VFLTILILSIVIVPSWIRPQQLDQKRQPHPGEVDTVEPITTAIVAAVTAGITDIGKDAFGGTYQGLKDPIKSKFGQDNKVSRAIAELEDNPESKVRHTILAESIVQEKADRDPELIHLAQRLVRELEETEQGRWTAARYQIDARDAQISVTGDKAHIKGWVHFQKATTGTSFGVLGVVNGVGNLVSSPTGTLWVGSVGAIKR
jgi:hypothetical protein